ncbi:MAG: hypothetical protein KGH61_00490 [Candidatus Micrarchaeota archaeon]|nr:hypothetical protein [Candidatus Micrarchaeota archaeon]MDE1847414.1 hypothetical protein [Candidatus Micrarchaeota archaeon]MDE1864091.1 hypothetical protein [Candidatus Micrarchaeota archaeon]
MTLTVGQLLQQLGIAIMAGGIVGRAVVPKKDKKLYWGIVIGGFIALIVGSLLPF